MDCRDSSAARLDTQRGWRIQRIHRAVSDVMGSTGRRLENRVVANKGFVDRHGHDRTHSYPRGWLLLLGGSGEPTLSCLMQAHELSPLSLGETTQRRSIIRLTRTLRIRQGHGLEGSTAVSTSPLRAATILTRN